MQLESCITFSCSATFLIPPPAFCHLRRCLKPEKADCHSFCSQERGVSAKGGIWRARVFFPTNNSLCNYIWIFKSPSCLCGASGYLTILLLMRLSSWKVPTICSNDCKKVSEVSPAFGEVIHLVMTITPGNSSAKGDKAKCRSNKLGPCLQKHLRAW